MILNFSPSLDVGGATYDIGILNLDFFGPATMLSTFLTLPGDLGFLALSTGMSLLVRDQTFGNGVFATSLNVGPAVVPEPALLLFLGSGLAGAVMRRSLVKRRSHKD